MTRRMDEQVNRRAPRTLTDQLDTSTRDLASGRAGDASAVQREARRILEAFEKTGADTKGGTRTRTA